MDESVRSLLTDDLLGVDKWLLFQNQYQQQHPFWNNFLVSQLMLLYYKVGSELILTYYNLGGGSSITTSTTTPLSYGRFSSRQALHVLLSSSCILFWPLFVVREDDWSWQLNVLVPSVMMARFFYKGAILKDPEDVEVRSVSRSSSPSELLLGPLLWAAVLTFLGLYRFRTKESAIQIAAVGIGDALAPWFGSWYGRHVYHMPLASGQKTMEGSLLGVFLGTCVGIYICLPILGLPLLPLHVVLVYGAIAAVVEGTSPGHVDNLTVPLAIHFSMSRIEKWLPD